MDASGYARRKDAICLFCALMAASLLAAAILLFMNARVRPVDADDFCEAPASLKWGVEKLENETTVMVTGWIYDEKQNYPDFDVYAVLRDGKTGRCLLVPTAQRSISEEAGESVPEEYADSAGFFARGVPIAVETRGLELCLLYTDGLNKYLIPTDMLA